jgi:LuxR family maltose regulon positive regulatory protein
MQPDRLAELHGRAAMWCEQNGLAAEAIEHWLAAPDHEQAARIVEENAETMHWGQGEPALVRYWLEHLPHEVVLARPRLCLAYVWALATTGLSDKVEPYLRAAQDRLREGAPSTGADAGTSSSTAPVPGAEAALGRASRSRLLGEVAGIRASLAWHRGDLADAIQQYQRALAQLPEDDPHLRSRVMMGLAEAYFLTGDARSASQAYQTINDLGQKSHSLLASLAAMARLWHLQVLQGRLRQAAATCSEMQQLVEAQAELPPAVAGVPAVAGIIDACQGDLLREWNELEKAEQRLRRGVERGQRSGNPLILLNSYVGLARVLQARGETDAALQAISSALQVERQYHVTWTRGGPPVSTYGAHLALMQDHLAAAVQWADEQHLQITDDIPYPRELDYLTLARVLLAQGRAGEAMGLLKRLQLAAESSGRFGRALEAQMLRALAYRAQDNISQALEALSQALAQAQPEGYVRLFVDEGEPMRLLILDFRLKIEKQARSVSDEPARRLLGYADTLLTSFDRPSPTVVQRQSAIVGCKHPRNQQSTIEALSEREMEVLRLMAAGKSNQEIARTLVITVGTVKTHNNHIFSKLGVQNRAQAIVRAQALGLI